jgi:hypothetical protein
MLAMLQVGRRTKLPEREPIGSRSAERWGLVEVPEDVLLW